MQRVAGALALFVVFAHNALGEPMFSRQQEPSVQPPGESAVVRAQVAERRETFDVASIRAAPSGSMDRRRIRPQPAGLNATNATALDLIEFAFDVIARDVVGELPGWVNTTRFDVAARTEKGPLTPSRVRAMTRALLEDRFRLDAVSERADGRVYALVRARSDDATGPSMRPSESTCEVDAPIGNPGELPVGVLDFSATCGVWVGTSSDGTLNAMFGSRVTMQEFAKHLSRAGGYDRPIVDRTGLSGEFDVAVTPQRDMVAPTSAARFLIALREQAGLILRTEQGSFDVVRIRRIEQPSPN